jgi:hypothetical protein
MSHVDVWSTEIDDKPGGLALKLRAIGDYGVDLDCVIARREPNMAGKGLLFVSPLDTTQALENADQMGLKKVTAMATLRVEGSNQAGMGARITNTITATGVNMHGLSAMTVGNKFVCYLSFDSVADREKAETALRSMLGHHDWRFWRHTENADAAVDAVR